MRGSYVLRYLREIPGDYDTKKELVHAEAHPDVRECRAGIRELFGDRAAGARRRPGSISARIPDVYLFDYSRPVDTSTPCP
jgi:hypothetical protein